LDRLRRGGAGERVGVLGKRNRSSNMTLCVEMGTAGQAAAPCDLVARKLWHSELQLGQTTASTPSFVVPIMHARSSQSSAGPS
ncbi:hypothetical protein KCU83_g16, partial [Aureobasidium melanogenum]